MLVTQSNIDEICRLVTEWLSEHKELNLYGSGDDPSFNHTIENYQGVESVKVEDNSVMIDYKEIATASGVRYIGDTILIGNEVIFTPVLMRIRGEASHFGEYIKDYKVKTSRLDELAKTDISVFKAMKSNVNKLAKYIEAWCKQGGFYDLLPDTWHKEKEYHLDSVEIVRGGDIAINLVNNSNGLHSSHILQGSMVAIQEGRLDIILPNNYEKGFFRP